MTSFKDHVTQMRDAMNVVNTPFLDEIYLDFGEAKRTLFEGGWYDGRFERNIRIDDPTHGVGQRHAHIHGRKGTEVGAVNVDGTPSHKSKMRLHDKDAEALRALGFTIPKDNIVEWTAGSVDAPMVLLG